MNYLSKITLFSISYIPVALGLIFTLSLFAVGSDSKAKTTPEAVPKIKDPQQSSTYQFIYSYRYVIGALSLLCLSIAAYFLFYKKDVPPPIPSTGSSVPIPVAAGVVALVLGVAGAATYRYRSYVGSAASFMKVLCCYCCKCCLRKAGGAA